MSANVYNYITGMDAEVFGLVLLQLPDFIDRLFVKRIDPDLHSGGGIDLQYGRALTRLLPVEKGGKLQSKLE
jgi:hypothetical protein